MTPIEAMKNRLDITEMKEVVLDFLKTQGTMEVAIKSDSDFPIIERASYKYVNGKHILL